MGEQTFSNRLVQETSPYLLQHAHNPVDWYPWGEEALRAARTLDRPIFLSIGYSACHWCHVMERESFEDEATARVMNELFINVKVDREERPDLDQIYMSATQLISGHGGWPMSVWLSPDLKPYYAGTYFPPQPRHGLPGFVSLCRYLAEAWKTRRQEVIDSADGVVLAIEEKGSVQKAEVPLDPGISKSAGRALARYIDTTYGGFGSSNQAPKFPHSTELRVLLRAAHALGDDDMLHLVELSLDQMIRGGIYDQLGGGFHRYSTDRRWLVPHFEKMLYDNALIPLACVEAAQVTDDPRNKKTFLTAAQETIDYILREMTSPAGAFYSTQDADSEGEEGKFFVWTKEEVVAELGEELGEIACRLYDVTPHGNWEEKNILHLPIPMHEAAQQLGLSHEELEEKRQTIRCKLFGARSRRIAPGRDEKVLTAWNGMMIDMLATVDAGRGTPALQAAENGARFVLDQMRTGDGRLYRTHKEGRSHLNGYLEDYAYFANGLVSLYEATFDPRWIASALEMVDIMVDQFWDDRDGGFFFTGKDHERLIARSKDARDNAVPSSNAMAATALARLAKLTGRGDLSDKLEQTFSLFAGIMRESPMEAAQLYIAWDLFQPETREIVLAGDPTAPAFQEARQVLRDQFVPNKIVAGRVGPLRDEDVQMIGLLEGKESDGSPVTIHVCKGWTCASPTRDPAAFRQSLRP